ncbi:MAG: electron transfer flavoprotein subunit alpha/FixB family protein [Acidobacteria bacterium]|uniref:Electron transfer flavoprotein subunit alpha n=1 Tax=Candidatus Sulfomarinibacter kjeldsenii TaxID=2885994 RepID=A0A8J6Y4S7_9BACT|nr:electron transfer flavoprotein subunit alpha/FixB family protein [Candidatus Sulfomarinibacter kjeldsenii]
MMAGILVFVEQRKSEIRNASLQALSEAKRQGGAVSAVLPGSGIGEAAAGLGAWGADKIYVADDPNLDLYSSDGYAEVVVKAVEQAQPSAIFFAGTAMGRDLAPTVAARLGVGAIPDAVGLELDGETFSVRRPVYSGKATTTADTAGNTPQIISLRPNVFAAEESAGAGEVVALDGLSLSIRAVVKELLEAEGGELDVAEADVIVAGGRGIKGPENFALIKSLADALGGAVGASRAAVDAGWIEHSHQVGQTGKVVSPSLYVAAGISGAIQHLAGMSSSKVIVAINKDPDAPIFKIADYGIVGDLFDVIPPMVDAIKAL